VRSLQGARRVAAETDGLDKMVTVHTLRHSNRRLEQAVDIRVIQDLLGHRHIDSTSRYARIAVNTIRQVKSPLDALNIGKPPRHKSSDMFRPKLEVVDIAGIKHSIAA
jgi:integrase